MTQVLQILTVVLWEIVTLNNTRWYFMLFASTSRFWTLDSDDKCRGLQKQDQQSDCGWWWGHPRVEPVWAPGKAFSLIVIKCV